MYGVFVLNNEAAAFALTHFLFTYIVTVESVIYRHATNTLIRRSTTSSTQMEMDLPKST